MSYKQREKKTKTVAKKSKSLRDIEFDETENKVQVSTTSIEDGLNLKIKEFPWTEDQKKFINICLDKKTNFVFNSSTAGTGKSLCAVYCALKLLNDPKSDIKQIVFLRNPVPSSDFSLGFLKGTLSEKFAPFIEVAHSLMKELMNETDCQKALQFFHFKALEHVKSLTFGPGALILVEEYEDLNFPREIRLVMSRIGKDSRMLFIGDVEQSDIKNSCGQRVFDIFDNEESKNRGIHCIKFDPKVTLRNPIISFVLEKLKGSDWTPK